MVEDGRDQSHAAGHSENCNCGTDKPCPSRAASADATPSDTKRSREPDEGSHSRQSAENAAPGQGPSGEEACVNGGQKKKQKSSKPCKADVAKSRLSFGDELEEDGQDAAGQSSTSRLGAVTTKRFQAERKLMLLQPAAQDLPSFIRASDARDLIGHPVPRSLHLRVLGEICVGASCARGARPYMEDCHTVVRNFKPLGPGGVPLEDGVLRTFAGVYDAHNGIKAAEHASTRLHMALAQEAAVRSCTGEGGPGTDFTEEGAMGGALRRVFHAVDKEILDRARAEGGRDGTTALVVLRVGSALFTAHAGDSRAVLCRNRVAVRLTEDHKPNLPLERQRVEAAGGRIAFQRCWRVICEPRNGRPGSGLAISRSFGDLDFKEPDRFVECEPDVKRTKLGPGDSFVIMGSDGLWDVMDDQTACDIAQEAIECAAQEEGGGRPSDALAKAAGDALLLQALNRASMDNVTVLVLLFQWA